MDLQKYQELEKNDLALAQYEIVFKQAPNLHSVRFDYANLLADMGKNSEAVAQYKIYSTNFPNDVRVYKNLGLVYKRMNDFDNTIASYEKALTLDSKDVNIKKELANCYHMKKDYISALKYYNEVLQSSPNDYDVKVNKAIALHALKKYEDSIALYREILSQKDNTIVASNLTDALVSQGRIDLDAQNYSKASGEFEQAIARGTKDSFAYFGLAKCLRVSGSTDKAAEYYEKAISMSPEETLYSSEYAEFVAETNALAPANPAPAAVETPDGKLPSISLEDNEENIVNVASVSKSQDLISQGDENYKKDAYDEALKNYKSALKVNPNDEITLLKIGNIYKIKNDNDKALDFYKKAIFVNPNYTDGWFNLGLVYANDNNIVKSKECFEKVISLNPEYAYSYYALAIAYESEDNKEEAVKNYQQFLKHNKDASMVKVVEDRINNLQR